MFVRIRSGTPPRLTMGEPISSSRGYVQEWLRGKRWVTGRRADRAAFQLSRSLVLSALLCAFDSVRYSTHFMVFCRQG